MTDPRARERCERPGRGGGGFEHDEPAAATQHARDLGECGLARAQVADPECDRDRVERRRHAAASGRHPRRRAARPRALGLVIGRHAQHRQAHIHAEHGATRATQPRERHAAAGAQVEHAVRRRGHLPPHRFAPGRVLAQRHDAIQEVVAPGDVVEHERHLT
jgi:hypothetical protein